MRSIAIKLKFIINKILIILVQKQSKQKNGMNIKNCVYLAHRKSQNIRNPTRQQNLLN